MCAPEPMWTVGPESEHHMRVGVFGAGGRMGAEVCRSVADDPELTLVAGIDPFHAGIDLRQATGVDVPGIQLSSAPDAMTRAGVEVAIDFTHHDASLANLRWCAEHGIHAVVGTTGFSAADIEELRGLFVSSNCLIAPNFAIGAVLMMRFAELAAPYFDTAEIIEFHHDAKIDAPSGTAMATVERMGRARANAWAPDPTEKVLLDGARGGKGPTDIRVHAVRMRGMVAHQEVILGTTGQTLVIRHDTTDRTSFMPGVMLAVKKIAGYPGLTVGLDAILDL
jgi:4-hydroxy-tetrahydrodipicolinate reductase